MTESQGNGDGRTDLERGFLPSPMACPHCGQGVINVPTGPRLIVPVAEPVICCHCHGICISQLGQLRRPSELELGSMDWDSYREGCRELADRVGPPTRSNPHRALLRQLKLVIN
jgi:hypothetical protein